MTPEQRSEYTIAIAMLRGCELTEYTSVRDSEATGYWIASGCGYSTGTGSKYGAADRWLKHFGIHINERGEIADLSTKVEA